MTFLRPEWLALLGILPLLIGFGWWDRALRRRRGGRFAQIPADPLAGRTSIALAGVGGGLLAIAAAGPGMGNELVEVSSLGSDVVIAIDGSQSMRVRDIPPDRLSRAQREAIDLAERFTAGRVGLVVFGGEGEIRSPLTQDRLSFVDFVREIDPDRTKSGSTDLAAGLHVAMESFDRSNRGVPRSVVVFSDGENLGDAGGLDEVIARARQLDVTIHAILVGTETGGVVPDPDQPNRPLQHAGRDVISVATPDLLRRVAAATGGEFVDVTVEPYPSRWLVERAFDDVSRGEIGSVLRWAPIDRFRWFVLVGIALLALSRWRGAPTRQFGLVAGLLAIPLLVAWTDPASLAREGSLRFQQGDQKRALELYREATAQSSVPPSYAFNLGVVLRANGDLDAALTEFERTFALANKATDGDEFDDTLDSPLRGAALFAIGVTRVEIADGNRADELRQLTLAQGAFVGAVEAEFGANAAWNLEVVSRRLRDLKSRRDAGGAEPMGEESSDGSPDDPSSSSRSKETDDPRDAGAAPNQDRPTEEEPRDAENRDGPSRADRSRKSRSSSSPSTSTGEGEPTDGEGSVPSRMSNERSENLFEIVRRLERERMNQERRLRRGLRVGVERDW